MARRTILISSILNSFVSYENGARIPRSELGPFQVDLEDYSEGSVKAPVLKALEVGYRRIDVALGYGWVVGSYYRTSHQGELNTHRYTSLCHKAMYILSTSIA